MAKLLQTKIELPPLRQQQISRERVLRQVKEYPAARLILVSAPAGFGKSTSLLQWAHRLREGGSLVAWYAVDERDNDPARFAAYLLGAFRVAGIEPSAPDSDEPFEVHDSKTGEVITRYGYAMGLPQEDAPDSYCGMIHGTGHGVGLEVHEPPLLDMRGPELVEGDVLTIEPGLYCRALGGVRVEDMVVVTREGCDNLNCLHEGLDWN